MLIWQAFAFFNHLIVWLYRIQESIVSRLLDRTQPSLLQLPYRKHHPQLLLTGWLATFTIHLIGLLVYSELMERKIITSCYSVLMQHQLHSLFILKWGLFYLFINDDHPYFTENFMTSIQGYGSRNLRLSLEISWGSLLSLGLGLSWIVRVLVLNLEVSWSWFGSRTIESWQVVFFKSL